MTDPVKAKIIELVPDINERVECDCSWCGMKPPKGGGHHITGRPITLADVVYCTNFGEFDSEQMLRKEQEEAHMLLVMWNPKVDFDNQDQPTKDFIGRLLNVTT